MTASKEVRYIFFGNTGVGKSTLGNRLLAQKALRTSDDFASTTQEPFSRSNTVNGVKITVTDTVGLNDAQVSNDQILKDLSLYLQNDFHGPIHYFLLLIKFNEKITINFVENLNMLLSSFVGPAPTQNIKIVVTHAKGPAEKQEKKVSGLREQLEKSFQKYSSEIQEQVKQIPILLINNHENINKRTPIPPEIDPFRDNPAPINPKLFSPKGYNLITKIVVQEGFINKSKDEDGITIRATLVHRKHTEYESFDKNKKTQTEWEDIDGKKPKELNIQYAEYGELQKIPTPINRKDDNKTIKGNIYHEYKNKRIVRVKFNKIEKQGEPEEGENVPLQNSEVFFELPNTLEIDGHTHKVQESKN